MCEPTSILAAVSVAQAGLSIVGQQQQHKAQVQYQIAEAEARNEQILSNRTMASHAYIQQLTQENLAKSQEDQSNAEQAKDLAIQRMKAQGTAKAEAADAGVDGQSLGGLIFDFERQESMVLGRLDLNQQFRDQARVGRAQGYGLQLEQRSSQIPAYRPSPVAGVDYLTPILGIAKTGADVYYKTGQAAKPKVPASPSTTKPLSFPQADSNFFS